MAGQLAGKRAIVTGASRGIGAEIAARFSAEGAIVALMARDETKLEAVAEGLANPAIVIPTDVLSDSFTTDLQAAMEQLGGVDIVVNNAGGNSFSAPVANARFSGWQKTMELNLSSTVLACQTVVPALAAQESGAVINLASIAGIRGAPLMAHYGAAKAAIVSLTQSLAVEVAGAGVRVNALLPGWIETDLTDFLRHDDNVEESVLSRVPMHRWGTSAEIADAALFLAGDQSSFMTGQTLVVDGGLSVMP